MSGLRKALALLLVLMVLPLLVPLLAPCEEDESCWDCHTMGNRICGPAVSGELAR